MAPYHFIISVSCRLSVSLNIGQWQNAGIFRFPCFLRDLFFSLIRIRVVRRIEIDSLRVLITEDAIGVEVLFLAEVIETLIGIVRLAG